MFSNVALDVFIGLVFVFLLYSLLATIVQEMIATRLGFRAKVLEKAILRMLDDGKTANRRRFGDRIDGFFHLLGLKNLLKQGYVTPWFYVHPLIKYLAEDNYYSKPAYLDKSNFSKVIIDLLKGFNNRPESETILAINESIESGKIHKIPINIENPADKTNPAIQVLKSQIAALSVTNQISSDRVDINPNTKLFLQSLWRESGADLNVFKQKLEEWFDDTMERATGWYKKYTQIVLFILGLIIAVAFNVDTIAIYRILSTNKPARDNMVQLAIASRERLDPDKVLPKDVKQSDSLLNETYKMVAADANAANDVLGLGRPWSDSCETCKATAPCKTDMNQLKQKIADSIKQEESILTLTQQRETEITKRLHDIDSALKKKTTFATKTLLSKERTDFTDSLKKLIPLEPYKQLISRQQHDLLFITRCEIIGNRHWLQYSPNQRGGVETILGWLITALALILGAPFWFDLLAKLVQVRGAGANPGLTGSNSTSAPVAPNNTTGANNPTITVNTNAGDEAVG